VLEHANDALGLAVGGAQLRLVERVRRARPALEALRPLGIER
jgi:hypothetical protein